MDLTFLRRLAFSHFPRAVPPGPAFDLLVEYQTAGYVVAVIPHRRQTRTGSVIQDDALVTAITAEGLDALGVDKSSISAPKISGA